MVLLSILLSHRYLVYMLLGQVTVREVLKLYLKMRSISLPSIFKMVLHFSLSVYGGVAPGPLQTP